LLSTRATSCSANAIQRKGNKKSLMTLAVDEFMRRLLLHLLPPGFVRIRNFLFAPVNDYLDRYRSGNL
jgi:hypothetical protein